MIKKLNEKIKKVVMDKDTRRKVSKTIVAVSLIGLTIGCSMAASAYI